MRAFLMIHLCNKMTDMLSRFVDVLVVVEVNFFLFEGLESGPNFRWQYKFNLCSALRSDILAHVHL